MSKRHCKNNETSKLVCKTSSSRLNLIKLTNGAHFMVNLVKSLFPLPRLSLFHPTLDSTEGCQRGGMVCKGFAPYTKGITYTCYIRYRWPKHIMLQHMLRILIRNLTCNNFSNILKIFKGILQFLHFVWCVVFFIYTVTVPA